MDKKSFKPNMRGGRPKGSMLKNIAFVLLLVLVGLAIWGGSSQGSKPAEMPFSEVIRQANAGEIQKIEVSGEEIKVYKNKDDKEPSSVSRKEAGSSVYEQGLTNENVLVQVDKPDNSGDLWANLGISLLPVLLIGILLFVMLRSAQGQGNQAMSFGKSRARLYGNEKDKVTFNSVAGSEEA
ncbi:ATP-dependent metallopeptidase FtsH/Yme1/Tma family protein, partial [Candidatus Saccharibacteria bacterium]|nr:ATP-dependent metallopeptidase FtsH/Yme1/Tma family protein [Candidatus Saccharibacteria bacterium]